LVFSLFGKKTPPPAKKPAAKSATGKTISGKAGASSMAASKPAPAPSIAPSRPAAPTVVAESPSLDFSAYTPSPKRGASGGPREPDSVMSIEVTTASGEVAPVIEETAILFANGQADQALAKLSLAAREEDLGASALQCWLMLFDVHQHLGRREEFESLALEFVVKFERSAPAWRESGVEARANPALLTGGTGYCAFAGSVLGTAAEFDKLANLAQRQHMLRVDFGKIEAIDAAAAERLRQALVDLRASGKEVVLTGEAKLLELLERACRAGDAKTDRALWALLLETYKWFGHQERFEEAAVNYAVTFEVSPPSWEQRPPRAGKPRDAGVVAEPSDPALVLSGDVTGVGEALVKDLQDWAAANNMLVIDMSKARRVDFVSAGVMLNALSQLRQAGTTIQIRGANEMIAALFEVMGVSKVATVIRRK
jgi:anti-anti-sigma regulatory factor